MTSGAPANGPLSREAELEVLQTLSQSLVRPVGIDVWTRQHSALVRPDRDPCEHCEEQLALMRQFVRLSPLLSITTYDIDRHAARATEVDVDMTPATIVRCAGRSVQFVGMSDGTLLRALLDVMSFISIGTSPLNDESREVLGTLTEPVHLELLVAPYDQLSAFLMRLVAAVAVECRVVRVKVIDATEYPMFASIRSVTEVPVLTIEARRFTGIWDELSLVEQIRRIATGDTELVQRNQTLAVPFVTEAAAREHGEAAAPPPSMPGGLYIPGR